MICFTEYGCKRIYAVRLIKCDSPRNLYFLFILCIVFIENHNAIIKISQQLITYCLFGLFDDDHKFVSSDAVYDMVFKSLLYQSACIPDQHVTEFMSKIVIDLFKVIDIHDYNCIFDLLISRTFI